MQNGVIAVRSELAYSTESEISLEIRLSLLSKVEVCGENSL